MKTNLKWIVYVIRLSDNSLYTGITNKFFKRLSDHISGKGSKYVRSRLPIKEVFCIEFFETRSEASKREAKIKKMKKKEKERLHKDLDNVLSQMYTNKMTREEQIRIMTAIICGPKILNNASEDATIKTAERIAEKIYDGVEVQVSDAVAELLKG